MIRCYRDLKQIDSFKERYLYLKVAGKVGEETFGIDRYVNQQLYRSQRWKRTRSQVIIRDNGCDLGVDGHEIDRYIVIHHMNPITLEDIEEDRDEIYDPEYLICCSSRTHQAIHFGDEELLPKDYVERRPNDTCLWR
jgi:hypothetical protein